MIIKGENNFEIFKLLLDQVAIKSELASSFENFNKGLFDRLSQRLKGLPQDEYSPVSASTLRDYRYMSIKKIGYSFKVDENKLNHLTTLIDEGDWRSFVQKHSEEVNITFNSFYKSSNLYQDISQQKENLANIYSENTAYLRQYPSNPEYLFNLAVCQLYNGAYKHAVDLLHSALYLNSNHGGLHHFLALSLFSGARPFRHQKSNIDKVITHLSRAIKLEPEREDSLCLKRIVQTDFHARIGYSFIPTAIPELELSTHMISFFSKCIGIEQAEIKSTLL